MTEAVATCATLAGIARSEKRLNTLSELPPLPHF
jgi:hypothetical protein